LSPIVVVPKKNGKLIICIDFWKLNATHKEGSIPITFHKWSVEHNNRVWGIFFLDGYSWYHQIYIASKDRYKIAFVMDWGDMEGDVV
jgi:hypothetical protein